MGVEVCMIDSGDRQNFESEPTAVAPCPVGGRGSRRVKYRPQHAAEEPERLGVWRDPGMCAKLCSPVARGKFERVPRFGVTRHCAAREQLQAIVRRVVDAVSVVGEARDDSIVCAAGPRHLG